MHPPTAETMCRRTPTYGPTRWSPMHWLTNERSIDRKVISESIGIGEAKTLPLQPQAQLASQQRPT